ncbi:efflux RND transporter periplasmic adaptor subunit [Hirschia litorea]|uniref:Efflux RND transporter periplasmic adaptor subunit n=1 Tax=Hirschia litorea TaxID=1199156 RepID=A0ABW2ILU9_9PROT
MKFKSILKVVLPIAIIGGGIVVGNVLGAMKPPPEEKERGPIGLAVLAEEATLANVSLSVEAQGAVRPKRQVQLSPQVSGRVKYVSPNLENGGFVKRGEVLIRLEDADYKLSAVRASSTVASARQALATVMAQAEVAKTELQELGIKNPSPLALREPQLAEARAALAAAEAQAEDAALQLQRTEVRAPFDGLVESKSVELGQFVSPGSPIGQVFAKDAVEIELAIPNEEMGDLGLPIAFNATKSTPGPKVSFSANIGGKPHNWVGTVTRTGASVDTRTRLVSIFSQVDDPFGEGADNGIPLAPGLFVDAVIEGRTLNNVIQTPRSALRGLDTVYVVNETEEEIIDRETRLENEKQDEIKKAREAAEKTEEELGYKIPKEAMDAKIESIEKKYEQIAEENKKSDAKTSDGTADKEPEETTEFVQTLEIRKVDVLRSTKDYVYISSGLSEGEKVIISPVQAAMTGMRVRTFDSNEAETDASPEDDVLALASDTASGAN